METPKSSAAVLYALAKLGEFDLCTPIIKSSPPTTTLLKNHVSFNLLSKTAPVIDLYTQIPLSERDNNFYESLSIDGSDNPKFMQQILHDWLAQGLCARVGDVGMERMEKGKELLVQTDKGLGEELCREVDVEGDLEFVRED